MQVANQRHEVALLLILLVAAALRFTFSVSISGNDDLAIAGCALQLLDGGFIVPTGHYCARFGLILPLAAIFEVAGTGLTQISLIPAAASLASILLCWSLGARLFGPAVGLAAAAAMALFPMDIQLAGMAFPDTLQGALMAAAMLCLLRAGDRGWGWAVLAGALWAWAYYVKLDAALLVIVIGLAWLMGYVRLTHAVIAGVVALALVGIELAAYGHLAGEPFLRVRLDSTAANEALAPGQDYRKLLTYPKAMFLVPYETGLHYYAWALALAAALWTRSRPALLLVGWSGFWLLWLMFGADPFSGFRLKPQLSRYLLSFAVPAMVLAGWLFVSLWREARILGVGMAAGAVACTIVFAPFNQLSFEAAQATRLAVAAAQREGWFPLCPDVQSAGIVHFLLRGRPEYGQLCVVQRHDFLHGVTTFSAPPSAPAYLLINEDFARRLERRSLVRPVDPAGFGLHPTLVMQIDNPSSAASYAVLRLLSAAARLLPSAALRDSIGQTTAELLRDADVRIWRLDPAP